MIVAVTTLLGRRRSFTFPFVGPPSNFHFPSTSSFGHSNFHFHPGVFRSRKWKVAGRSYDPHEVISNADNLTGGKLIFDPAEITPVIGFIPVEDIAAAKLL